INLLTKLKPFFSGGGSALINGYCIKYKNFNEKFYFGTQNIYSLFSSYYSLKWFLRNKKFIFFTNFYIKKNSFLFFKKKKKMFTNIFLLKCKNISFLNFFLDINKI
ncbi:hypothetical protein K5B08_01200, partial [Candidatus Carsonella ruddii]|nr:hypothetical protein [Candidatus Carsonella ruddii]